jgi:hypothetical protein
MSPKRPAVGLDWFKVDRDFLRFADELRPWQPGNEDPQKERFPEGDLPRCRPLRIYTQDPAASSVMGNVATIELPFEPLAPGPVGSLVEVFDLDATADQLLPGVDLETRSALLGDGRPPSLGDTAFHQQMTYAVAMRTWQSFRTALGRDPVWGFRPQPDGRLRLRIRPHAFREANAYYSPATGELLFGYFDAAEKVAGRNRAGGRVYTCLSHDIIAHETTHALLDGMRRHFFMPSNPEVLALHEAVADLVAVLLRFSYPCVVDAAIARSQPNDKIKQLLLTAVATQFGQTTGMNRPLRSAVAKEEVGEAITLFDPDMPPHDLGAVLLQAVFEAFNTVFERKTRRVRDLAERYRPAGGPLDPTLASLLADQARTLARQFLSIVIRAIDYCPPVDVTFGDYLRAMITADVDLVPDDPYGYRDALIDAFARRSIAPLDVPNLAEDVLVWKPPQVGDITIPALHFEQLRLGGDPRAAPTQDELERQAGELGRFVIQPAYAAEFGLALPDNEELEGDRVGLPLIASIRSLRRISDDRRVRFGLVAEVIQERHIANPQGGPDRLYGGSTVIIDSTGRVEYVIRKRVTRTARIAEQRAYAKGNGAPFWQSDGSALTPTPCALRGLHTMRANQ